MFALVCVPGVNQSAVDCLLLVLVLTSVLPPAGVEVCSLAPPSSHRRGTNIVISMATTAVTMVTMVSMGMGGRGGLGQRRILGSVSWKLIGSERRRCWTWAAVPDI